ncbi:MAG TPA: PAS domain S-box protein [Verrucomicrobiae bacterium]
MRVGASCGFDDNFLGMVARIQSGKGACGTCLREKGRIVVEDTEGDPLFEEFRVAARAGNFRACHSVPLLARGKQIVGVLTAHFQQPHQPEAREKYLLDIFGQIAADFIERIKSEEDIRNLSKFPEQNPAAVMRISARGILLYANRNSKELLGQWKCADGEAVPERMQTFLEKAIETNQTRQCTEDCGAKTFLLTAVPFPELNYLNIYAADVTEAKRSEEALHRSQEQFRLFVEQAPAALAMLDREMHYLAVSRRWVEEYKLGDRKLSGESHYSVFPDIPAQWKEVHRRALVGEILRKEEDCFTRADGTVHWLKWEVRPWRDAQGAIGGIIIFSEDISARKETEQALAANERELSLIFANVSDVLFYLGVEPDGHFRFVSVNDSFFRVTGLKKEEVIGARIEEVIPEPSRTMALGKYQEAIRERKTIQWEETSVYPSGRKTGIVSVTPIYDERGVCTHLIGGVHDITQRKSAEERFRLVADHMPALITYVDRSLIYQFNNAAYAEWYQRPLSEITGRHMREVLGEDIFELRRPYIEQVLKGETMRFEGSTRHGKLGLRECELAYVPDAGPNGEVRGFYAFIHDITERKEEARNLRIAEERFRLAAANDTVTLYEQDAELRYTWLYPMSPFYEQSIGQSDEELLPNEDGRILAAYKREVLRTGHTLRREVRVRSPRREVKYFDLVITPKRSENGDIIGIAGAAVDITDRKRADEANLRLAAIVESSEDAIMSKDLAGMITSWNQAAERIFGYSASEAIGQPLSIIIPEELRAAEVELTRRIQNGERMGTYETRRKRKDGVLLDVSVTVSPLKDPNGTITGMSKIDRDITEQKKNERELKEAQQRLAEINAELEQRVAERTQQLTETNEQLESFVYTIAHDLRAPLRSMQAFSTMLLDDYASKLDSDARNYANRIVRAAERMDTLVLDLLAYGRVARAEISLGPCRISDAWALALAQHEHTIRSKEARIDTGPSLPLVVAHEPTLAQALSNLLGNALKFVQPGTTPQVHLSTELRDAKVRIWLADNGIGIAPEYHERIFRIFERLNGPDFPGTGIGLSIVRKGIERMGGAVGIESEPGKWSRFWIELPKA